MTKYDLNNAHYVNGWFVATSVTNNIFIGKDGESWQRKVLGSPKYNLYSVTYGKGIWIAGGAHGQCYTSNDGIEKMESGIHQCEWHSCLSRIFM